MNRSNNSTSVENSLEARDNADNSTGRLRAAAVVVPPVVPPVNQEDLANVVKELEYLTSLGLTRNSDNEAMKTALRRYKELTGRDYEFPTTTPELAKVRKDLEYLTSLGLTRNSDNEAMKKALIEYRSLTGNEYEFPEYGIITTIAWPGATGINGYGVAVDGSGNVLIADNYYHRIRGVAAGTGILTTVAGNGVGGYSGDGNDAKRANLSGPRGVAVDGGGNIFIADTLNHCIRRVEARTGIITTVAGNGVGGYSGDGSVGTRADLDNPTGVAVDGSGNVLIADSGNNRIRRLAAGTGVITTVAGNGVFAFSGDGGPGTSASLAGPTGLAVDGSGNVLIADTYNCRIRRVAAGTGVITTVAGNGVRGFSGDGGPGTSASLRDPIGVAVDGARNVYIVDNGNNRIRKLNNILAAPRSGGRKNRVKKSRGLKKSRRVKKSRVLKKSRRVRRSKN